MDRSCDGIDQQRLRRAAYSQHVVWSATARLDHFCYSRRAAVVRGRNRLRDPRVARFAARSGAGLARGMKLKQKLETTQARFTSTKVLHVTLIPDRCERKEGRMCGTHPPLRLKTVRRKCRAA